MAVQNIEPLSEHTLKRTFDERKSQGHYTHLLLVEPQTTEGSEYVIPFKTDEPNDGALMKQFAEFVANKKAACLVAVHYLGAKNFRESRLAL